MVYKFTKCGEKVLSISNELAIDLGHSYIGTEHILYGLICEENGVAGKALKKQNLTPEDILDEIEDLIGGKVKEDFNVLGFTPRTKKILENSYLEAKNLGTNFIGTEHILIGLLKETECIANRILEALDIKIEKIYSDMADILNDYEGDCKNKKEKDDKNRNSIQNLMQFGNDLTKQAKEGKLDPVIGRNEETDRIIEVLSRRIKNNPCLIGEPGVGKTAVIEGLAQKIINNSVPDNLKNKKVITLDIPSLVAGAKYRGDFEDRVKKCLAEAKKMKDIILFVDEIHTIVGAGAAEGAIDAANILKPMLARGEIRLIGATTLKEYRKYIEKDQALERRFQPIYIEEPSIENTIEILNGIKNKYEDHHKVRITENAIKSAVELSNRYINDRFLPDKAIDLIDEASSKVRLKSYVEPSELKKMQNELDDIINLKEQAISEQNYENAANLRDREINLLDEIEEESSKWQEIKNNKTIIIDKPDIEAIISKWTGIPVYKISETENEKLRTLEENLGKRVIGQKEAIHSISNAIRRSRVGIKDPNRPIGSFLFLGPTGVGKTELTKSLAECLFGNENAMIRVDMSEYMESSSVSKLIGSPPGYVGYDDSNEFTEKVRLKPYSVILFDEIEKAHPDVLNLMLQILEDGILTDSQGRKINFRNSIIVMTSNIGARKIVEKKKLGFSNNENIQEDEYKEIKKSVIQEVKKELKPEFINRLDELIIFHKLEREELKQIVSIMLDKLLKRLNSQQYFLEIDDSVKELIIDKGYDKEFGARPIRRAVQNYLEDILADEILNENIKKNEKKCILANSEKIIVK